MKDLIDAMSPEECLTWYNEQKANKVFFDSLTYKLIMNKIGQIYETEMLEALDHIPINEIENWIDNIKNEGKTLTDKVWEKAMSIKNGTSAMDKMILEETEKIYSKCSDDLDEIDSIRKEDDELMDELERWLKKGLISDVDDAKEWLKNTSNDKIYTNKYLKKRAKFRLLGEGIII